MVVTTPQLPAKAGYVEIDRDEEGIIEHAFVYVDEDKIVIE